METFYASAPTLEQFQEFTDDLGYQTVEQDSNSTLQQISDFKSVYFHFEPVFRSLDENANQDQILEQLLNIDSSADRGMYQLALHEKIFLCHMFKIDRHSSTLELEKISHHLQTYFSSVNMPEVFSVAEYLQSCDQTYKAIIYYQLASVLAQQITSADVKYRALKSCVLGLKRATDTLVTRKSKVSNYTISLMTDLIQYMKFQQYKDEKKRVLILGWSMFYLTLSFISLKNWNSVKTNTKDTMLILDDILKREASKFWIYGVCSHYLGLAHFKLGHYHAAVEELSKTVSYRKTADDYVSPEEKQKKIEMTERLLKQAQQKSI